MGKLMKNLTIAFIGHRDLNITKDLIWSLENVLGACIVDEGAKYFLFGSKSNFNDLCYRYVSKFKRFCPDIVREYIRADYEFPSEKYAAFLRERYEKTEYPSELHNTRENRYVKRNKIMIDRCDILVTYYNKNYVPENGFKSGTRIAVEYAKKKRKRVINLFDSGLVKGE